MSNRCPSYCSLVTEMALAPIFKLAVDFHEGYTEILYIISLFVFPDFSEVLSEVLTEKYVSGTVYRTSLIFLPSQQEGSFL